jgi:hypothetical protein
MFESPLSQPGFEAVVKVTVKVVLFWDVTPYSLVEVH